MSISLLRFPHLALDEILKNMSFSDIFVMSVCSERLGNYIVRNLKFKNVAKISYIFESRLLYVNVEDHSGKIHPFVRTDCDEEIILNTCEIKIGGISNSFYLERSLDATRVFFFFNVHSERSVKNSVISHCTTLLQRYPPTVQWRLVNDPSLGIVPLFGRVDEMCVSGENIPVQYVITCFPNLNCLRIQGYCKNREKFSGVDNLQCDRVGSHVLRALGSFTGRYLYLQGAQMSTDNLMEFCSAWQRNRLCQDIRFVYIHLSTSSWPFDLERFHEEFETQEWDSNVRPGGPFGDFPFMIDVHDDEVLITDEFRDIQRNDGKWASLRVMDSQFFMIVWD